jgi:hypothetical protein
MNRKENLDHYEKRRFSAKTFFRAVELMGRNMERIIYKLQDAVLNFPGRPKKDVLPDWTSIVDYSDMVKLAKYGYSRDHNLGERQLTHGRRQLCCHTMY